MPIVMAAIAGGCTTGSRKSLSFAPPTPWKQGGGHRDNEQAQGTAQANVPVPSRDTSDSADTVAADIVGKSRVAQESDFTPDDADDTAILRVSNASNDLAASSPLPVDDEAPPSDARIQQLKAALTADVERSADEQEQSVAGHPLRIRAESMLQRAENLWQQGQLHEARRAAQQAVELTESFRFEFLPTEERPLDLLRKIEAAISRKQTVPSPLDVAVNASSDGGDTVVAGDASAELPKSHRQPVSWLGEESSKSESVMVAANRPVILPAPTETVATGPAVANIVALAPLEAIGDVDSRSAGFIEVDPAITELRPFRGESSTSQPTLDGPALGSLETAPLPPDVAATEPLPSFPSAAPAIRPPLVEEIPTRPLFSQESLLTAIAALGAICCITGAGLVIRHYFCRA